MPGGSRGIGLAIAIRLAREGVNIPFIAKTDTPHPRVAGTVHTAADEIEAAASPALPILGDIRDDDTVSKAVTETAGHLGALPERTGLPWRAAAPSGETVCRAAAGHPRACRQHLLAGQSALRRGLPEFLLCEYAMKEGSRGFSTRAEAVEDQSQVALPEAGRDSLGELGRGPEHHLDEVTSRRPGPCRGCRPGGLMKRVRPVGRPKGAPGAAAASPRGSKGPAAARNGSRRPGCRASGRACPPVWVNGCVGTPAARASVVRWV
ncbi:SDR family NAD(P)-dependent oxidoreductase, partial [Streptomyces bobili]|uniref:SDR family NAD(P)-dependent oxidoreductase n=1 Tax=Streptomyces bobili TaxID=67280 RepID=UPI003655E565